MKYIDVRVRMPTSRLGIFIDELPEWAQMVGYDRLENGEDVPVLTGGYQPGKGSAAEAVLKVLAKGAMPLADIRKHLGSRPRTAVYSGLYLLVAKKIVKKLKDGRYALKD